MSSLFVNHCGKTAFFVGEKNPLCAPIKPRASARILTSTNQKPIAAIHMMMISMRLTQRRIMPRSTLSAIWPAIEQTKVKGPVKIRAAIGTRTLDGRSDKNAMPPNVIRAIKAFFSALSLNVPVWSKTKRGAKRRLKIKPNPPVSASPVGLAVVSVITFHPRERLRSQPLAIDALRAPFRFLFLAQYHQDSKPQDYLNLKER